jgi:hypothetical protein
MISITVPPISRVRVYSLPWEAALNLGAIA